MKNKCVPFYVVVLLIFLVGFSNAAEPENQAMPLPETKVVSGDNPGDPPRTLRRNAGTEWSRQKIREYLTENTLSLEGAIGRNYDYVIEDCRRLMPKLETLDFEFIKPDLIVDDWNDPRLDVYKQKYQQFHMGSTNLGPAHGAIPTWNINLYGLDVDADDEIEDVLYGENLKSNPGAENERRVSLIGTSYRVFKSDVGGVSAAVTVESDPSHPDISKEDSILSALFRVEGNYSVIVVQNHNILPFHIYQVDVYLLTKKMQSDIKQVGHRCSYSLHEK